MIRQEIVICEKCGSLKELSNDCKCSDEKEKSFGRKDHNDDGSFIRICKKDDVWKKKI